jgi:hypothetical protein
MSMRFVPNMAPLKYVAGFSFGVWLCLADYPYTTWQYWVLAAMFGVAVNL